VPVQRGAEKIGVLVVQHQERHYFDEFDVMAMRAIASQLAGAVGNARLLIGGMSLALDGQSADQGFEMHGPFKGQVASSGCAFAPATVFDKSHGLLVLTDTNTNFEFSLAAFHCAVQDTTDQLQQLQIRFAQRLAESASLIFTAHLMILKDARFISEMEKLINIGMSVAAAVKTVAKRVTLICLIPAPMAISKKKRQFRSQHQNLIDTQALSQSMSPVTYTSSCARF
jgi:phosphotransferase system enzyme I (PtsP)